MPLGRLPEPANVAEAVLYLAKARNVTGQIIFVDGGANLKSFARDFMHL
jgi:NAD(P)-dependent dehydrogenase (short-subunit alcohol dehydrogenase family)